jgi:hypothetical protein
MWQCGLQRGAQLAWGEGVASMVAAVAGALGVVTMAEVPQLMATLMVATIEVVVVGGRVVVMGLVVAAATTLVVHVMVAAHNCKVRGVAAVAPPRTLMNKCA